MRHQRSSEVITCIEASSVRTMVSFVKSVAVPLAIWSGSDSGRLRSLTQAQFSSVNCRGVKRRGEHLPARH